MKLINSDTKSCPTRIKCKDGDQRKIYGLIDRASFATNQIENKISVLYGLRPCSFFYIEKRDLDFEIEHFKDLGAVLSYFRKKES